MKFLHKLCDFSHKHSQTLALEREIDAMLKNNRASATIKKEYAVL